MIHPTRRKSRGLQRMTLLAGSSSLAVATCLMGLPAGAQAVTPKPPERATDVVVVTGIRAALQNAQAIKRASDVQVDSVSAQDIGALPDRSITEALQRIPGVSINKFSAGVDPDHFSVEGSGVTVRGLTFAKSEFNGRDTFTANNGRALSFSDVSPELIGGVDVYKSQSADQVEGGIAGLVNLRTLLPFDRKGQVFAFSLEANHGDFAEKTSPTYSLLATNRWQTRLGEFGLMGNYAYSQLFSRGDGIQLSNFGLRDRYANGDVVPPSPGAVPVGKIYFPRGAAFRSQNFNRERTGEALAAQWRSPDRTMLATLQYLRSEARQQGTEYAVEIATDNVRDNGDSQAVEGTSISFGGDGVFTGGRITGATGWAADQQNSDNRTPRWGLQSNNIRRDEDQTNVTSDLGANFKWDISQDLSLALDYQHVSSNVDMLSATLWTSTYQNADIRTRGSKPPVIAFLPPGKDGSGNCPPNQQLTGSCPTYFSGANNSFSNPFNSFARSAMDHIEQSDGTQDAARIDVDWHPAASRWIKSVRGGVRYGVRDQTTRFSRYNWGVLSEQWGNNGPVWLNENIDGIPNANGLPNGTGQPLSGRFETFGFHNFLKGKSPVPTGDQPRLFLNFNAAQDYARFAALAKLINGEWQGGGGWVPLAQRNKVVPGTPFLRDEINPVEETNQAAYALLRFGLDLTDTKTLSGNLGLRYTMTERTAGGLTSFQSLAALPTEQACADPSNTSFLCRNLSAADRGNIRAFANDGSVSQDAQTSFDFWLPSLNLKYEAGNGLQFRLGLSKSVTPPDIGLVRNATPIALDTSDASLLANGGRPVGRATAGNPNLRPITSSNLDMSLEYYFANLGQLTGSFFFKKLDDVITNSVVRRAYTNNGATFDAIVTTPVNSDQSGYIRGFEFTAQRNFDFLPGIWSGLGASGNYTYIDSRGVPQNTLSATDPDVAAGITSNVDTSLLPLPNLSKHQFNAQVFYEKGPLSLRLAYNWRSKFLITLRDVIVPFAPIYNLDSGQLDASASWAINERLKIGFQAVNLTNDPVRTTQVLDNSLTEAGRSWFYSDTRYSLFLRGTF